MNSQPAPAENTSGPLPGMAVIAIWMAALCFLGLYGVITHHLPMIATIVCALFAAAAHGLVRQMRWGWALTLAAAFLSMTYAVWLMVRWHQSPAIVMAVVNLIFFLYLVRPEVIERLK
ncbi:hypothetical protein [Acidipila rosea]|uniref:Uncharacterized protein n=1 Tax=Acidipila rosea TaxID=768535 RepID=A0A4R1KYW4_9BACT|nr:hypothetical protein [Acidipila rosea]MBW4027719.1 hypothetical protein [Acidobacteriota bacterium]MBW4045551.1 hypothetical protein [Acidobacteriota bacterium]TCK70732.1 hypothetical protein C7378_3119 [Acidipila rosea]